MSNATITFVALPDGAGITLMTRYEGGFDPDNHAHRAAAMLGAKMHELAEPRSEQIDLSEDEVTRIAQGGDAAIVAAAHAGLIEPETQQV